MANLGLRSQWTVRFCRLKKVYEISLEGVVQTRLEWKRALRMIGLQILVWVRFGPTFGDAVQWSNLWVVSGGILGMGCRAGRSARLVTQVFLGS